MILLGYLCLFVLFVISTLICCYFLFKIHRLVLKDNSSSATQEFVTQRPVSVIIAARNEATNLKRYLPSILNQDYPEFEVIVVNDRSVDDTEMVLKEFMAQYSILKVVEVVENAEYNRYGKKFAITMGIKGAKYEHLLFTDADCEPNSNQWIQLMQSKFTTGKQMVLGISPYTVNSSFLNKWIQYETFHTAINYIGFARIGNPYMGIGRNMGYLKSLFFEGKGFASHMDIPSGDDDLFVNQHANSTNTAVQIQSESLVLSEPKQTWGEYFRQKLRHFGAGKAYRVEHQRILTLQFLADFLFNTLALLLLALQFNTAVVGSVYILKQIIQSSIYYPILKLMRYPNLVFFLPIFDLLYPFYILVVLTSRSIKTTNRWK